MDALGGQDQVGLVDEHRCQAAGVVADGVDAEFAQCLSGSGVDRMTHHRGRARAGRSEQVRTPVGAFGGRRDVMEQLAPLGPVYQAGTLSGNPLATTAGLAPSLSHGDR